MKVQYEYTFKFVLFAGFFTVIVLIFSVALKFFGGDIVSAGADGSKTSKVINIVIDPGHGGEDGGANANGVREKDINLAIGKDLAAYFGMSSYTPALTRTDDVLLYKDGEENRKKYHDLINRVKFANSFDDAVFVSIHQNKFEIPKYKGLQVYYSPNNELGKKLADTIQSNSRLYIDSDNNRQTKKADHKIRVLNSLEIPAVLVECGFLSNSEEAEKLKDEEYQKKLAFMIFISSLQFINENGEEI